MSKYRKLGWSMLAMEIVVLVSFGAAMCFYPEPYSWPMQFLSALGLTRHENGSANWISCLFFNTALVGAGIATAAYFIFRALEFRKALPRRVMIVAGVLSGIGLAAIGLIPYNIQPELHNWATYISMSIGAGIILPVFQADNRFGGRAESICWCIFGGFVIVLWLCLNHLSSHANMLPTRPTQPFMQKMLVAFFLCYMIYQALALVWRKR